MLSPGCQETRTRPPGLNPRLILEPYAALKAPLFHGTTRTELLASGRAIGPI